MSTTDADVLIIAPRGVAVSGQVFRRGQRALVTRAEAMKLRRYGLARLVRFIATPVTRTACENEPNNE